MPSSTASSMWPAEDARQAKLVTPKEWRCAADNPHCILRYMEAERLLAVVSCDNEEEVLDVIDVDDMIGAKLSMELNLASEEEEPVAAANPDRASNEPATDALIDRQGAAVLTLFTYPRQDPAHTTVFNMCNLTTYKPQAPNPNYARITDPAKKAKLGHRVAFPRQFTVAPAEDLRAVSVVAAALQQLATTPSRVFDSSQTDSLSSVQKPPTYLILVNPCSGPKRNGVSVAREIVMPMLEEAGIMTELCITNHAGHATERCAKQAPTIEDDEVEKDLLEYTAVIFMGGDGIIHEALQGIMGRDDWQTVLSKVTFGVVGCGTANGFATSITHHSGELYGPTDETYLICKGQSLSADLSRYSTANQNYTSFLTFSWAMIADIDIESEKLHWLGPSRFDVWGVWRVLSLRRYKGRLSYRLPSTAGGANRNMPALDEAVPADWQVVEDDFLLFWASHVTHAGMTAYHSPKSTMNDGIFQIMVVRGSQISRYRMARILLGIETGAHVDMPGVEFIQCTAYRLEKLSEGSFNDLDGEVIEDGPIQGHVLPAAWNVFATPLSPAVV